MGGKVAHLWRVESWLPSGSFYRLFAACDTLRIGIAAYDRACLDYPLEHITLKQGMQLLRDHPPDTGKMISRLPAPIRAEMVIRGELKSRR